MDPSLLFKATTLTTGQAICCYRALKQNFNSAKKYSDRQFTRYVQNYEQNYVQTFNLAFASIFSEYLKIISLFSAIIKLDYFYLVKCN